VVKDLFSVFKNFIGIGIFQGASLMLQLLALPLIIKYYGLEIFGQITVTTNVAFLLGNLVNYGTNQTAVKEVAINRNNQKKLSKTFSEILLLRFSVFIIVFFLGIILIFAVNPDNYLWISIAPLIMAEIFNPLFFLIGIEKVHWISVANVVIRALSLVLILLVPLQHFKAVFLNLFIGLPLLIFYIWAVIFIKKKYKLNWTMIYVKGINRLLRDNFYVIFNGSTVLLQQSIFLWMVAGSFNSIILGCYGIIDKLINAIRQIVSAFSSAVYPRASSLSHENPANWEKFRSQIQWIYFISSIFLGIILYIGADEVVGIFSIDQQDLTINYIKIFAFVPLLISFNANNIIDMLIRNYYSHMFFVSLLILLVTVILSLFFRYYNDVEFLGWYPVGIEAACLLIYSIYIKYLKFREK
jgi:O-antigen/teichoic acid export membrane protein